MYKQRFIELAKPYTMLGEERIGNIYECLKYIVDNNIEGDIVQCGVWKGGIIYAMIQLLESIGVSKTFYLYDTFEGMTEPSEIDVDLNGTSAKSILEFIKCNASFEDVNFLLMSVNTSSKINMIRGDIRQTLLHEENKPKKISLLHLDTDFYDSTLIELNTLWNRISPKGICVIDDYGHWNGCRTAVDEYFNNFNSPDIHSIQKIDYTAIQIVKN